MTESPTATKRDALAALVFREAAQNAEGKSVGLDAGGLMAAADAYAAAERAKGELLGHTKACREWGMPAGEIHRTHKCGDGWYCSEAPIGEVHEERQPHGHCAACCRNPCVC